MMEGRAQRTCRSKVSEVDVREAVGVVDWANGFGCSDVWVAWFGMAIHEYHLLLHDEELLHRVRRRGKVGRLHPILVSA